MLDAVQDDERLLRIESGLGDELQSRAEHVGIGATVREEFPDAVEVVGGFIERNQHERPVGLSPEPFCELGLSRLAGTFQE